MRTGIKNLLKLYFQAKPEAIRGLLIVVLLFCGVAGLVTESPRCYICIMVNVSGILLALIEFIGFTSHDKLNYLVNYKYREILNLLLVAFGCAVFITELLDINTQADRFFTAGFIIVFMANPIIHKAIEKAREVKNARHNHR